jgi:endo-1,4-beta-D-glucanase Y/4-amino-4-deoxy-L-arabinose transferase-like glycosyltransferase
MDQTRTEGLMRLYTQLAVFVRKHATVIILTLVLLVSGFSHGYNMRNYPYYESDEGTYTSQAWSILTKGELAPYTYWYDHPPLGWITLALWAKILPNDFFTFGTSIDTGRVLMLLVHLVSTALIFFITKRLTKSNGIAAVVCLLYSLSPLGIYFRRRVLLDNLMNMWLLASLAILFFRRVTLKHFALSGLLFAFAFLTKISALFFAPTLVYIILTSKYRAHKLFRSAAWIAVAGLTISIYPLYAMLKGEFLPASVTGGQHVSLIESLVFQMSRGQSTLFFKQGSDFMVVFHDWLLRDKPYVILIGVILVTSMILAFRNRMARIFLVGSLFYILFLIRGNIVINFYIIPLISFVAILAGICIHHLMEYVALHRQKFAKIPARWYTAIPTALVVLILGYYSLIATTKHLTADEVTNQRMATIWIKDNLSPDADIIIDDIMLVELRDPRYHNDKVFTNAEWFYKVSRDPAIRDEKYNGTWRTFDYIGLTHEMLKQIDNFESSDITLMAFQNSLPIAKWIDNTTAFIDEQKFITTNGDWAMVYKINDNTKAQLVDAWKYYKENFIHSYGQVIDPSNGTTTSEGQSYAMLRAVWMNDKQMFDGVWDWTQHHLQHRVGDMLLSWKWKGDHVLDSANATDADEDIALALLFASKTWSDTGYSDKAIAIIKDIWRMSVVEVHGRLYILPVNASQAQVNEGYLFNPSYLSPAHYRIFAAVDPEHDWNRLANDSYETLNEIARSNTTGLPANWYTINKTTGELGSAAGYFPLGGSDYFSYDAFRTFWRVGLDAQWFNTPEAKSYLSARGNYLAKQRQQYARLPNAYDTRSGAKIFDDQSLSVQTGYLVALGYADKSLANRYYNSIFADTHNKEGFWGESQNYYDQNWVWFGSALFNDDLINLWAVNR